MSPNFALRLDYMDPPGKNAAGRTINPFLSKQTAGIMKDYCDPKLADDALVNFLMMNTTAFTRSWAAKFEYAGMKEARFGARGRIVRFCRAGKIIQFV